MSETPLKTRLKATIAASGPITVADFMATCLADPADGYYMTRPPFGREGDFITAPEVSQLFGELIAAYCLTAWEDMGAPSPCRLVELGPGRGTLMADFLRVAERRPAFLQAASLCLVETSHELRQVQQSTLASAPLRPTHYDRFEDLPDGPMILIANEFFDALPVHQFVKTPAGWRERMVGLSTAGDLSFGAGTGALPGAFLAPSLNAAQQGSILETQPAANAISQAIGARIALQGGLALVIDYGYLKTGPGDTLQALHQHGYDGIFDHPGQADLTAHVNFEALAQAAIKGGAACPPPMDQGPFLLSLGLLERAGHLGAGKSLEEQDAIRDAVERLAAPQQMGQLFKVMVIGQRGQALPLFGTAAQKGTA